MPNIDNSVITATITSVVGLIGIYLANRYTSRTARKAQAIQEETENRKTDLEQAESWRQDTIELRRQRDEDRRANETGMQRLKEEMTVLSNQVELLTSKVDTLNRERVDNQSYIDQLISWCRVVVVALRQAGVSYPPPPPGVTDTNPNGLSPGRGPAVDP